MMRYFYFEPTFKLRWYRAQDLFGSRISVTTEGFEQRISCIRSSNITHKALFFYNPWKHQKTSGLECLVGSVITRTTWQLLIHYWINLFQVSTPFYSSLKTSENCFSVFKKSQACKTGLKRFSYKWHWINMIDIIKVKNNFCFWYVENA